MAGKQNRNKFVDTQQIVLTVEDNNGVVGTVILKPNGVGWTFKGGPRDFKFVKWDRLDKFLNDPNTKGVQTLKRKVPKG